jgi:hypothetical protein
MLRDAAAFDISFKQFGQSGFMEVIEILCVAIYWGRANDSRSQLTQHYE